jgi:hypothetical protein
MERLVPDKKTLLTGPYCANCYQWTGRHSFLARLFGRRDLRTGKCLSACSDQSGKTLWWNETCAWFVRAYPK